jgi:hypothetical protein
MGNASMNEPTLSGPSKGKGFVEDSEQLARQKKTPLLKQSLREGLLLYVDSTGANAVRTGYERSFAAPSQ